MSGKAARQRSPWTTHVRVFVCVLAVAASPIAHAQPHPAVPPHPPVPAPLPPPAPVPAPADRPEASAIGRVARALAVELQRFPAHVLVAGAPLVSDSTAPRGAQLVGAVAAQLAGRRGGGAHARAEPATLAVARQDARGDEALVHVSLAIAEGALRATVDVYPVPKGVWAKIRDPEPGPIGHAFAMAPIDAEVRSFLAPIPLVAMHVERARNFENDVVALACGDLDGDGSPEIVSVSRRRVTTVRLRGGRVVPIRSRSWPDLAAASPTPLREPIAFATIAQRPSGASFVGFLDVGLTDRAKSVRLDGELLVTQTFPGVALPDGEGTACTRYPSLVMTGSIASCAPGDRPPLSPTVGGRYDAFASARLVSPRGEPFVVWVGREAGLLEVRDSAGRHAILDSVGAQLAVGDFDQDGEAEIVSTLDTMNTFEDAVVVRSWSPREPRKLRERLRIPAAAGVRAVAVCPPDGPGRAPIIVATADEIWVVR